MIILNPLPPNSIDYLSLYKYVISFQACSQTSLLHMSFYVFGVWSTIKDTQIYMSDILLRYVDQTRPNYLIGKWVFFTSSQSDVHFFFPFSFSFRWQGHATFAGELP